MERRRETKYFIAFMLWAALCFSGGCWLTDMKKDAVTGQEITNAEDITKKVQGVIAPAVPIANTIFPGSGVIIGGVALLLGLAGTTVTALVKSYKKGGALAAVIQGVELAADKDTKAKIKEISGAVGIEKYLNKIVKKYYPIKSST